MMRQLLLITALLLLAAPLAAQTITFAWDPHPESAVIEGFKLYQSKQSGNYSAGPVVTFTGGTLVTGIAPKPTSPGRYYWVLRAYMPDPAVPGTFIESGNSNEVTDVIKPKEPTGFIKTLGAIATSIGSAVKSIFVGKKGLRIE